MAYLLVYTKKGEGLYPDYNYPGRKAYNCDWEHAVHFAVSEDGRKFLPLRNNTGILFAKCSFAEDSFVGVTKTLIDPWIVRAADAGFRILAVRRNRNAPDTEYPGCMAVYASADLVHFEEPAMVCLSGTGEEIRRPRACRNKESGSYSLEWETPDGIYGADAEELFQTGDGRCCPKEETPEAVCETETGKLHQADAAHCNPAGKTADRVYGTEMCELSQADAAHCNPAGKTADGVCGTETERMNQADAVCGARMLKLLSGDENGRRRSAREIAAPAADFGIEGCVPGNVIEITEEERRTLLEYYGEIRFVGADPVKLIWPVGKPLMTESGSPVPEAAGKQAAAKAVAREVPQPGAQAAAKAEAPEEPQPGLRQKTKAEAPEDLQPRKQPAAKAEASEVLQPGPRQETKAEAPEEPQPGKQPVAKDGVSEALQPGQRPIAKAQTPAPELTGLRAVCRYSDGSVHEKRVRLDAAALAAVDVSRPGVCTIPGEILQKKWKFPLTLSFLPDESRDFNGMSDPCVTEYHGKYYLSSSGSQSIQLRIADTIEGTFGATPTVIYRVPQAPGVEYTGTWAGELHEIDGVLYLFTAICENNNWIHVRACVLRCTGDPADPASWEAPRFCVKKDGSPLTEGGISLDMTHFRDQGTDYVMWSDRKIHYGTDPLEAATADVYIGTVDPKEPWRLTSDPHCVVRPMYGWDRYETEVDEGPYLLRHGDDLFVTVSGSSTNMGDLYDVGVLRAKSGADLLRAENWEWIPYPLLTKESVPGEFGPGHNNFVMDPETGDMLMIYHAIPHDTNGKTLYRQPGIRRVHWAKSGLPYLEMTPERDLPEGCESIDIRLEITDSFVG